MKAYTLDTHILLWHLTNQPRKLSRAAKLAFEQAERGEALLYVSTISLIELWDVNRKMSGLFDYRHVVQTLLRSAQFVFMPFEADDAYLYDEFAAIPEGRDRIIALVSRKMDAPLITVDLKIIRSRLVKVIE